MVNEIKQDRTLLEMLSAYCMDSDTDTPGQRFKVILKGGGFVYGYPYRSQREHILMSDKNGNIMAVVDGNEIAAIVFAGAYDES
jgi:hypothetical protein